MEPQPPTCSTACKMEAVGVGGVDMPLPQDLSQALGAEVAPPHAEPGGPTETCSHANPQLRTTAIQEAIFLGRASYASH